MTIHDFKESLARSHSYENATWWIDVYRQAFPNLEAAVSVRNDGWAQRAGIDRVLTLRSGKTQTVDEKVREKDWPDVLLERWSNKDKRTPGWIQQELACDFIAYAYVPSRTCLLFPFPTLRRAWLKHGRAWVETHQIVHAQNNGYVTESVAVPRAELFDALRDAMEIKWDEAA